MDPISILKGLKNKVLDAKNFELLKNAYDLQNEIIEQLKSSNAALKEHNELFRDTQDQLQKENESLKKRIEELSKKIAQFDNDSMASRLSEVALAILDLYHQRDTIGLFKEEIISSLRFDLIQAESAIDDLKNANMIRAELISHDYGYGIKYLLTEQGKKYLVRRL